MRNKINQFDVEGRRHGLWKEYYNNGQLMYRGEYIHGVHHGPWVWYHIDGILDLKLTYKNRQVVGYFIRKGSKGTISEKKYFLQ